MDCLRSPQLRAATAGSPSLSPKRGSPSLSWADISDDDMSDSGTPFDFKGSGADQKENKKPERQGQLGRAKPPIPAVGKEWQSASPKTHANDVKSSPSRVSGGARSETGQLVNTASADVTGIPVEIEGMPKELCTEVYLDAIAHQAGLQDHVCGFQIRKESAGPVAVVKLSNWDAAMRCYQHFHTCSWSTGTLKVTLDMDQAPSGWQAEASTQRQQPFQGPSRFGAAPSGQAHHGWRNAGQGPRKGGQHTSFRESPMPIPESMGVAMVEPFPMECFWPAADIASGSAAQQWPGNSRFTSPMPYTADAMTHQMAMAHAYAHAGAPKTVSSSHLDQSPVWCA